MSKDRKPFPWPDRPDRPDRRADEAPLAWCGWELPVPSAWRPLSIEAKWDKGRIVMGSADDVAVQINWWRPGRRHFDARTWLTQRSRDLGVAPRTPPAEWARFSDASFMRGVKTDEGGSQDVLCGYSQPSDLLLEFKINSECDAEERRILMRRGLPNLRIAGPDEPVSWAAYDISFESPPGFTLKQWRFDEGDLSLRLVRGNRETLVVRQVYPAEIALQHRPMEKWLQSDPFDDRQRRTASEEPRPIQMSWRGGSVEGLRVSARNALPFPFHRGTRRQSVRMGLADPRHGRLLLMDVESRDPWRKDEETQILMRMNWHKSKQHGKE